MKINTIKLSLIAALTMLASSFRPVRERKSRPHTYGKARCKQNGRRARSQKSRANRRK